MTRKLFAFLAAGGSFALLAGAFAFQYIGGLVPCELCLWQRWPHAAAVLIGAAVMALPSRVLCALGAVAAATTSGIGVYHTGVERGWWAGPSRCTGGGGLGNTNDLLNFSDAPKVVMCDQVQWEMLSLSMASWNAIASAVFVLLWLMALRARD